MIPVPVMGMGVMIRLVPVVVPLGTSSIMAVTIPRGCPERNTEQNHRRTILRSTHRG